MNPTRATFSTSSIMKKMRVVTMRDEENRKNKKRRNVSSCWWGLLTISSSLCSYGGCNEQQYQHAHHRSFENQDQQMNSRSRFTNRRNLMLDHDNNEDENEGCFMCHVVRAEVLFQHDDDDDRPSDDESIIPYSCITEGETHVIGYRIELPDEFLTSSYNMQRISDGTAHVCIRGGYVKNSNEDDLHYVVVPGYEASNLQLLPLVDEDDRRRRRRTQRLRQQQQRSDDKYSDETRQSLHAREDAPFKQRFLDDVASTTTRRSRDTFFGTKKLLAVRVSSEFGEEPEESVADIAAAIFGTETPGVAVPATTVVDQFYEVSHGALRWIPATGPGIEDGVASVVIDGEFNMNEIQDDLMNQIQDATTRLVTSASNRASSPGQPKTKLHDVADYIIFCLADGSTLSGRDSWTAFTYLYEPYSYYQRSRCTRLSVPMHEMGHGLGFKHSGLGNDDYGDESGYMGYAVNRAGYPRKAYNGHKHWQSGWFHDRAVYVDPASQGAVGGRMISFVDYGSNDDSSWSNNNINIQPKVAQTSTMISMLNEDDDDDYVVLVRIGEELFLQYNTAKGYNVDTQVSVANMVTITHASHNLDVSDLVGTLGDVGESFTYNDYDETGEDLIIKLCSVGRIEGTGVDYVTLSIHLDDREQESICETLNHFGREGIRDENVPAGASSVNPPTSRPTVRRTTVSPTSAPIAIMTTTEAPTVAPSQPTNTVSSPIDDGIAAFPTITPVTDDDSVDDDVAGIIIEDMETAERSFVVQHVLVYTGGALALMMSCCCLAFCGLRQLRDKKSSSSPGTITIDGKNVKIKDYDPSDLDRTATQDDSSASVSVEEVFVVEVDNPSRVARQLASICRI